MPSYLTWPQGARPDYIIRDARRLASTKAHARSDLPTARTACVLLADHYAALASMKELKRVLDDYCDGVKP